MLLLLAPLRPALAANPAPSRPAPRARLATEDNTFVAQQRFAKGKQLYTTGDYAGALDAFRASLEVYVSPNTRLYVGRTLRALGRTTEAALELERTRREAKERAARDPRYQETQRAAANEYQALLPYLGSIVIHLPLRPAGLYLEVAGLRLEDPADGERVPAGAGITPIIAHAPGYFDAQVNADVQALASTEVTLTLVAKPPPPDPREPLRIAGYTTAAVGVASFGTFYFLANQQYQRLTKLCGGAKACSTDQSVATRRGNVEQDVAFASLGLVGVGGVLLGLGYGLPKPKVSLAVGPAGVKFYAELP